MEQSAYFSLKELNHIGVKFKICSPHKFGKGEPLLKNIDPRAKDCEYLGKFGWRSHKRFKKLVIESGSACDHIWITGTDIASLRASSALDLPTTIGNHYHHFGSSLSRLKWSGFYSRFVKGKESLVTFPTDFTRDEALSICPWLSKQSHVVRYHFPAHNPSADEKASAKKSLGINESTLVIGNAGWLIERKRWDVFLEVASLLSHSIQDIQFIICGGGPLEDTLRKQAEQLSISNKVRFEGWQTDLDRYYQAMDVLLFNSDFDALGRTPGEAMGWGAVPVASVRYGGLPELVENGVNGFFTDTHDTQLLADRILNLHASPDLQNEFRQAAANTLHERYSRSAATQFYVDRFSS